MIVDNVLTDWCFKDGRMAEWDYEKFWKESMNQIREELEEQ
jgi:hypothetical protein